MPKNPTERSIDAFNAIIAICDIELDVHESANKHWNNIRRISLAQLRNLGVDVKQKEKLRDKK